MPSFDWKAALLQTSGFCSFKSGDLLNQYCTYESKSHSYREGERCMRTHSHISHLLVHSTTGLNWCPYGILVSPGRLTLSATAQAWGNLNRSL